MLAVLLSTAFVNGCSSSNNDEIQAGPDAVNSGPIANPDPYSSIGNSPLTVSAAQGVLLNDQNNGATVTITLTGLAFYVNNTAAPGGNGSFAAPFDTLAAGVAAAGMNNTVFVYFGDGTATGQTGDITLPDG